MEILNHLLFIDQYIRKNRSVPSELVKKYTEANTELLDLFLTENESILETVDQQSKAGLIAMVAHSKNVAFQKKILKIIKDKYFDIVPKSTLAILEDKILVKETGKQKFGTQFNMEEKSGKKVAVPVPLENEEQVNQYREEYGLESVEDYYSKINEKFESLFY